MVSFLVVLVHIPHSYIHIIAACTLHVVVNCIHKVHSILLVLQVRGNSMPKTTLRTTHVRKIGVGGGGGGGMAVSQTRANDLQTF